MTRQFLIAIYMLNLCGLPLAALAQMVAPQVLPSAKTSGYQDIQVVCQNPELKAQIEKLVTAYQVKKQRGRKQEPLKAVMQKHLHDNNYFFTHIIEKKQSLTSSASPVPFQNQSGSNVQAGDVGGATSLVSKTLYTTYTLRHPYRYHIFIHGMHLLNQQFSRVKLFRLTSSSFLLTDAVREAQQQIYSYYIDKGYLNAKVTYKLQPGPEPFEKVVRFFVDEGVAVKISQIQVYGNISRPAVYYQRRIFNLSSKKIKSRMFIKKDLGLAYKKLQRALIHMGHLRAKVQPTRIEHLSPSRVKLYVFVNEGPLTLLQNISFEGNSSFSDKQLRGLINLQAQQALKIEAISQSLEKIKKFYREQGFMDVQIDEKNLIQYTQQTSAADVTFKITEGPQVRVRQIQIEGLNLTKAFVVRSEIDLKEGDILSRQKLDSTTLRLNQLALFSLVDVQIEDSTEALRNVIIRLQERKPGVFRLGLGVTDKSGYSLRGYVGVLYKNLAGTARSISSRFTAQQEISQVKYLEKHLILSYREPFLFSSWFQRLRGQLNLTYNEQVTCFEDDLLCPDALRGEKSIALTSFLEKNLGPHFVLRWKLWSLDWLQYFQRGSKIEGLQTQPQKIALVGVGLQVDYTDNILNPRRGFSFNNQVDYSSPYVGSSKDVHFVRAEGALHHHLPLGPVVWAHALRSGYVHNLSRVEDSRVPLKHIFFLGGSQTVRGFSGLGSHRIPSTAQMPGQEQWGVSQASWYGLFKSELRFPLRGKLAGVLFYDAGGVWVQGYKMRRPVRQSYGVGLRLNTPVGPLSLDYARKLYRLPFVNKQLEPAYHIHFSIGTF